MRRLGIQWIGLALLAIGTATLGGCDQQRNDFDEAVEEVTDEAEDLKEEVEDEIDDHS